MIHRRSILVIAAASLLLANIYLIVVGNHDRSPNAKIIFVGLDSFSALVPASHRFSTKNYNEWNPTLKESAYIGSDQAGNRRPVGLVSLAPEATYGKFIKSVEDLRARKICNVAIREHGNILNSLVANADGTHQIVIVPTFILCGRAIGDAGYMDEIPPDEAIRI